MTKWHSVSGKKEFKPPFEQEILNGTRVVVLGEIDYVMWAEYSKQHNAYIYHLNYSKTVHFFNELKAD